MQVVDFLAECLSVGLMSVGTIAEILSTERQRSFRGFTFLKLLPLWMMRVMDLASHRTSVSTVVKLLKYHIINTGAGWV